MKNNPDYNQLAEVFLEVVFSKKDEPLKEIQTIFEKLPTEADKENFDIAVGQSLLQACYIDAEQTQEMGQEIFSYKQENPDGIGYYVPGVLLISLSGAELSTTLKKWGK